eukprot:5172592-Alexandrium_andersonii.AAC.1
MTGMTDMTEIIPGAPGRATPLPSRLAPALAGLAAHVTQVHIRRPRPRLGPDTYQVYQAYQGERPARAARQHNGMSCRCARAARGAWTLIRIRRIRRCRRL